MKRRLTAIMALDVVGYSALMSRDEAGTFDLLKRHRAGVVEPQIAAHGGRVVKFIGDGVLAEFGSVTGAMDCAVAIQRAGNDADAAAIRLRIGIHLGDVITDGDDIYGDGVNVASRLEALAEPGGICLSSLARESLGEISDARFEDTGQHTLKNIERPIRVFRWVPDSATTGEMTDPSALLPDKPSIAVLPFANMSGDAEQEYFSDGVSEDIITELSRFSELFVIARNSSFTFKGQSVDVRDVARQLGVQFIVEGSVRKAGNRVRVTAQLIDALSGAHVWADRYDRELEDIFDVQDDVVRSIVAVLPGRVVAAGTDASRRKPTANLTAFDHLLRGNHALFRRGNALADAIAHYRKAIGIDPDYGAAHAGAALAEVACIWDLSFFDDDPLARALDYGKRAVELDPGDYICHAAYGTALRNAGQHEKARHHLERALQLNPNSVRAMGYYAMLQAYSARPQDAIDTYHRAVRLDPFSQKDLKPEILSEANYNQRDYRASIKALEDMLELPMYYAHQQLAICYAMLGEDAEAERQMQMYRAKRPENYDEMRLFESHMRLCQSAEDEAHWREGYRRVGLDV